MCSDHQSQQHRDADEDDKPPVDGAGYTELSNIRADTADHIYSGLHSGNDNVPTHSHIYANVSP